jgi:hypothetical protein
MPQWIKDDLGGAVLPDGRLTKRLGRLVAALSASPGASVPQACGTAGAKAAYRFWDNRRLTPQAIREVHMQATLERVKSLQQTLGLQEVEIIQDTTSLDYTGLEKTPGLGPLESRHCRGLMTHSAMLVANGVPQGLIHQAQWTRDPQQRSKAERRRSLPIEEKESYRWVQTVHACRNKLDPALRIIHIADREADIFELFADERPPNEHLLIRVAHNRVVEQEQEYLWPTVRSWAVAGTLTVQVPRSGDCPGRQAVLTVRFGPVTLKPPRHGKRSKPLSSVTLQAVLVEELSPPPGTKAVCWLLLTTLPVASLEQAVDCVQRYGRRWLIERYHFVLKSGCGIEKLQLEQGVRLQRAAATYSIVAWRVMWLTYQARAYPDDCCLSVLQQHEWQALYATTHRTLTMPPSPPTLREVVHWIAQLGGFMGRRGDGEPGLKTVWRGLSRLSDITATWQLLHSPRPDARRCG